MNVKPENQPTSGEQHDLHLLLSENSAFRKVAEQLKDRIASKWREESSTPAQREVYWIQIQCVDDLVAEMRYMRDFKKVDDNRLARIATQRKDKNPVLDV
jgi:hypothetical protein